MSESNTVYIFGYSGHAYVIIETLMNAGYEIEGYFDKKPNKDNPFDLNYCGEENSTTINSIIKNDLVFPAVGNNNVRKKIIKFFRDNHLNEFIAIDTSSNVSRNAVIGPSTFIGKNVVINPFAYIGSGVIVNTASIIEHECKVHDYSHVGPGATLCGNVNVGADSLIGANSVIREDITICENTIVGAGATVVSSIIEQGIYLGVPVRKYER